MCRGVCVCVGGGVFVCLFCIVLFLHLFVILRWKHISQKELKVEITSVWNESNFHINA